jgi:hypothetical protein
MIRIEHISHQTGDNWRIDVVVTGQAFIGIELKGSPGFYIDTFEDLNRAEPFSNPVQASRAEVEVYVQNESERGALATILGANEGSYEIISYRNGDLYKRYTLLPDLCRFDEGDFPYAVTLVGKDTTGLESESYGLFDDRVTLIDAIGFALGNVPIRTRTSWYHGDQADDFVRNTFIDRYQLRRLSNRDDQPDAPLSKLEVLSNIARAFKLFIRQHNGAWWIDQVSSYLDPTAVTQSNFTGSTFVSQSVVNTAEPTNTNLLKVVRGSSGEQIPAYRQITSTFDHRQRAIGISFPSQFVLGATGERSFEQFYSTGGNEDSIQISGRIRATPDQVIEATSVIGSPIGRLLIRVGSQYWNNALARWQVEAVTNEFEMLPTFQSQGPEDPNNPGLPPNSGLDSGKIEYYEARVSIDTNLIPTTVFQQDQFIRVTFFGVANFGGRTVTTSLREFEFNIDSPNQAGRSQAIVYQSERSIGGVTYDDRGRLFGDGPTDWATSAIRDSNGAVITDWFRRGIMDVPVTHALLLHDEIAGFHRNPVTLLSAVIRGSFFDLSKTLIYRGQPHFFIGGRLDAFAGEQTYTFGVNAWAKVVQDFNVSFVRPGSFVQSSLLTAVRVAQSGSWDAEGSAVFRLVVPVLSGSTVTSLIVEGETEALEGQVIRVVNPFTLASQEFVVDRDKPAESNLLSVESAISTSSFPAGSYLFLSARSVQAGILAGEDSVRIFAEANSIGVLTADVDGVVTSLDVRLYTRVRAGQDLEVIGVGRDVYRFTVGADYDVGIQTIDIDDFGATISARAGSIIIGNPVSTQAEFNVSPGEIAFGVDAESDANSIAVIGDGGNIDIGEPTDEIITTPTKVQLFVGDNIVISSWRNSQVLTVRENASVGATLVKVNSFVPFGDYNEGDELTEPSWKQSSRITVNANQIVLKVDSNGKIALISLIGDPDTGTEINIEADQINIAGQVTFLEQLYSGESSTGVVISATTAPTQRPNTDPLEVGDVWLNTTTDKPYIFNGTDWTIGYTAIHGGTIQANTITANKLSAGVFTTIKSDLLSDDDFINEIADIIGDPDFDAVANVVIKSETEPTERPSTDPLRVADVWIDTTVQDGAPRNWPYVYDGSAWIAHFTRIDGGTIITGSITAGKLNVTTLSAITADLGSVTAGQIVVGSTNKLWLNDAGDGVLAIGGSNKATAPFRVNANGDLIASNAFITGSLATGAGSSIDGQYLVALSIGSASIANGAIVTAKIGDAQITTAKIVDLNVTTGKIADLNVTNGKIANLAVDNAKIADLAVTTAKIGSAQITTAKIADLNVTNAKIANLAVTNAKINDLNATKINAGFLSADRIQAGSLNADKITAGTITATQIASGAITADKINVTDLSAVNTNTGNLDVNGVLTIGTGGSADWTGGKIDSAGIKLTYGGYNSTPGSAVRYLDGTTEKVAIHAVDAEGLPSIQAQINDNSGVFVFNIGSGLDLEDRPRVTRQEILSPSVKSAYKSSDGSTGITQTIIFNDGVTLEVNTVTIKNGIITGWTQII